MPDLVLVSEESHYAVCTLNFPAKRNPLSPEMRAQIVAALESLLNKEGIRSVILTGAGSAFCSGMDLKSFAELATFSYEENLADSQSIRKFFDYIISYPKPVIAAVNGSAVAGGCGLALLCDVTVAASNATFCFSEVKIGFVPAIVSVYLQLIVGLKVCRELLLTARTVSADEALAMSLVNRIVKPENLMAEAVQIAVELQKNGPSALSQTKALIAQEIAFKLKDQLDLSVAVNARARRTTECQEGVRAFLQKRLPNWV